MNKALSTEHKKLLEDMKKQLTLIGSREANYIKVELLFYEAMTLSRTYGESEADNNFLAAMKNLQANQYQNTKELFKKSTQREHVIKRFMNQFKIILSLAIKNAYLKKESVS